MQQSESTPTPAQRLPDWFWERHANPWSGGTRFAAMPVLLYAIYHRRPRLLAATVGFLIVNPVLFPKPAPERTDNWLSEVVRAERWWYEAGHTTFEPRYPGLLNYLSVPALAVTLYAAIRRRPRLTVVGGALTMALKIRFVDELVKRYREEYSDPA